MNRKRRKGAAAVEFAIVALLFFLFIFGMIEFGRTFHVQHAITSVSRAAAREAALPEAKGADVLKNAQNDLKMQGFSTAMASFVGKTPENTEFGRPITVQISVKFSDVALLSPMWGDRTMVATTTMRSERQ